MQIAYQEFFESYKDSLGVDGSHELLKKAIIQANLYHRDYYSKDEAIKICMVLQGYGGFVGIIGGILASRFEIR
jgi:hypothetical protein